jgi:2-iminobutanoate/2-iminopropanoate deaminase
MRRLIPLLLLSVGCSVAPNSATSPAPEFFVAPDSALRALPFSEAVAVGNTLYLSGQIGVVPGTLALVPGGLEAEAAQAMENIKGVLERHGSSLDKVVKCTVFMADMAEWPAFNAVYRRYFSAGRYPARSAFGSNGLALGARVEVECIAVR